MSERQYPAFPPTTRKPSRPLSFVVVRFCDEYLHNAMKSPCLRDSMNQLITIENTANLNFGNLSQAINAGIEQAQHELVVICHEDELLSEQWQSCFEESLEQLEAHDPNWGLLGIVGWTEEGEVRGHHSDPYTYRNTFTASRFQTVERIDEQLMVLRRSSSLRPDNLLPSIHNIGRDLALTAASHGMGIYVVNAPAIHKYADEHGGLILKSGDSAKIKDRASYAFRAERELSDDYFFRKWPKAGLPRSRPRRDEVGAESDAVLAAQPSPVILLSRGGGGSRLLSVLARDSGVFIGSELNPSGDSLELVIPMYKAVLAKFRCSDRKQLADIVPQLRSAAAQMIRGLPPHALWGFKLPESMLILPELEAAFPGARFVQLLRDPLRTCLRRTHQTARLDNQIGRAALPAAYKYCHRALSHVLSDSPAVRMAYTTIHQLELVLERASCFPSERYFEIRFDGLMSRPGQTRADLCAWLHSQPVGQSLEGVIDFDRAGRPNVLYSPSEEALVRQILAPLRMRLDYTDETGSI